jgi:hypothetical protein
MRHKIAILFGLLFALWPLAADAEVHALPDGATAQIGKAGDGLPCFVTRDKLNNFVTALGNHDKYGEADAMSGSPTLHRGDHVRAIEHGGFMWSEVRIRLESGSDEGASCWEPADLDGLFINIRQSQ